MKFYLICHHVAYVGIERYQPVEHSDVWNISSGGSEVASLTGSSASHKGTLHAMQKSPTLANDSEDETIMKSCCVCK